MNDYENYRRTQIEDGKIFQDFVVDVAWQAGIAIAQYTSQTYQYAVGESRGGMEIKHDKRYKETGNVIIEVAEKARPRKGPYVASGIMREDHWLYVVGDYNIIFFFANNLLRALDASGRYRRYEIPTSQGFLLPDKEARKYAALILTPNAEAKVDKTVLDLEKLARELHQVIKTDANQMTLFKSENIA